MYKNKIHCYNQNLWNCWHK